jgi:alkanesulfonate monooxygenase SsuD/methylene tetrahydromethanopterin reductase-like flavin-dependent oxidoreductase (luciferase family)
MKDIKLKAEQVGKDPASFETHLYQNININEDGAAALEEADRFLQLYYDNEFDTNVVREWTATGTPDDCVRHLRRLRDIGFDEISLRICSWDQMGQLDRLINEVVPRLID